MLAQTGKRIQKVADDVAANARPKAEQAKQQVTKLADTCAAPRVLQSSCCCTPMQRPVWQAGCSSAAPACVPRLSSASRLRCLQKPWHAQHPGLQAKAHSPCHQQQTAEHGSGHVAQLKLQFEQQCICLPIHACAAGADSNTPAVLKAQSLRLGCMHSMRLK